MKTIQSMWITHVENSNLVRDNAPLQIVENFLSVVKITHPMDIFAFDLFFC